MLIKEYRIPLPMSVEEYRIAQLYMIQKKSRVDSTGEGSGVEIIENCPYNDGPGGSGQYTKKIYHIGNHIPGWLKAIVPKSALQVIEEAWNAYPYTKMKTICPFVEKFYVEVETKYLPDNGSTENVFKLTPAKLRNQTVDLIDPVKDPIPSSLYKEEEDPLLYVSKKTGRGPLTRNWLNQPQKSIMCAYKKISVEFKYWGMQNKIEQFIHDGLRRPMQMGHRQAWVWQDEWYGLTIEDIRKLEEETQRMLAKKMGKIVECSMSITHDDESTLKRRQETPRFNAERKGSSIELLSQESVEIGSAVNNNTEETIKWKIGNDSSSDDEFFDAEEILNSDSSMDEEDMTSYLSVHKNIDRLSHSGESVESSDLDSDASHETTDNHLTKSPLAKTCSSNSSASTTSSTTSHVKILMLIIHGGNALDTTLDMKSKENDCDRLKREFQNVMQNHYKEEMGRVKFRLVECPDMLKNILPALKDITPQTAEDCQQESQIPLVCSNFSISSLSILAVCSSSFPDMVESTITRANKVYREFINSEEGAGFAGEVCIVGDCMGALIAYEAMCQNQWSVSSFDTNPSMPTSPVTDMERASGNNTIAMKNSRLSSSDFDIRGSQRDLPKHVLSTEERRSVSVEDSLDCVSDVCSFKTKKFEFDVAKFFAFGSPIGLVLLHKNVSSSFGRNSGPPVRPACNQVYNLFHPFEPLAARIEPLILSQFSQISSVSVPRYQKFPRGDGVSNDVMAVISGRPQLFHEKMMKSCKMKVQRTSSNMSSCSTMSLDQLDFSVSDDVKEGLCNWWGIERVDYALHSPKSLQQLPLSVLCSLSHISYWESKDVVAFMIRQIFNLNDSQPSDSTNKPLSRRLSSFHIAEPREKWLKKRTAYKIKNLAPNHRANDAIVLKDSLQIVTARFAYGPLDVATLTGEKVDMYVMSLPGDWNLTDSVITGSGGRASFTIPDENKLDVGIYPIKMVVRGDHTTVHCNLAVLSPSTEAVVFSIDGAFSASVSLRGRHPKVQPGAVDVVRHWQEHGYLIIYVTSRPDFQKNHVMSWMSEHNFPFGLVSFCGSLSTVDIQRHKTEYLKTLTTNLKITIHAAYGSSKDVAVYSGLGMEANTIFVIGSKSRKNEKHATYLRDGYSTHLETLVQSSLSRPAIGNLMVSVHHGHFGLSKKRKQTSK